MTVLERDGTRGLLHDQVFEAPPARQRALPPGASLRARRVWFAVLGLLGIWSLVGATRTGEALVNPGGWTIVRQLIGAATRPERSTEFLTSVLAATGTTIAYATVGTAVALAIGTAGGVITSRVLWAPDPLRAARRPTSAGHRALRASATTARGVHEAVWALVLLSVLGRDPWVAVLAIGLPFGAVTAKVLADLLDEADQSPVVALRASGAGRCAALCYGLGPSVVPDLVSYACYRFECALRASVVLGAIGAGGIGFELLQSFQSLRYEEIWTLVYVLCALALVVDRGSIFLRRGTADRALPLLGASLTATAMAAWHLDLRLDTFFDGRARRLLGDLVSDSLPLALPAGGWRTLAQAMVDTVQMSLVAMIVATAISGPLAFVAARPRSGGGLARAGSIAARGLLLFVRSTPPIIWAFVVLLVVFPGPLPGGLALGLYTAGVLGRLHAEVIENADPAASQALRASGAHALAGFAYGTFPTVAPRLFALTMYRWEVVLRETVIVGLVGAGGLGRLLAQQNAARDEAAMLTTILALIIAAFVVDFLSSRTRATIR
ncbi:MAG: ABC transporter permease subunit [Acidimicrobiales bacterium]